jgi:L-seryl-tRNA(Ser) seleniumtransferase
MNPVDQSGNASPSHQSSATPTTLESFGLQPIINASGTLTRLSGSRVAPDVADAMAWAAGQSFEIEQLQATACRIISARCGSEASLVCGGAASGLLLGAAAIIAGNDYRAMERLPSTDGRPHQFLTPRGSRHGYDHAIRAAGGEIVEVGFDEPHAAAGVRGPEAWEFAAAISEQTAGLFFTYSPGQKSLLSALVKIAQEHKLPVLVDAAAQLPPLEHLRSICASGADLVVFSGGKGLGGPQASGILTGKKRWISSAFLQMMDQDELPELWNPPSELVDRSLFPFPPRHGIGRTIKVGKEQIYGLLAALNAFDQRAIDARHSQHMNWLNQLAECLGPTLHVGYELCEHPRPMLWIDCRGKDVAQPETIRGNAIEAIRRLRANNPPVYTVRDRVSSGWIGIDPACLHSQQIAPLLTALQGVCGSLNKSQH